MPHDVSNIADPFSPSSALAVQHSKRKFPVILIASAFPLAGAAAMFALPRGDQYKSQLLAVYFLLTVYQCISPLYFSWAFANTAGHTKKTTTTGMLYMGLTVGNIVGPQLYKTAEKPYYHTGLTANLIVLCIMAGVVVLQTLYLTILNKRNERRRKASGKTGIHIDFSLESSANWEKLRQQQAEYEAKSGNNEGEQYNSQAFMDL